MDDPSPLASETSVVNLQDRTSLAVVFFDDMKGSTILKEQMAATSDEQAFHILRREHDALVSEVITRDGGGEILKSTGDGLIAIITKPSVAVERALEIQERLHEHPYLKVRIGLDMGEVNLESEGGTVRDAFGRHVDWAARVMSMADAGHICVTRPVYTDAYSWIGKRKIAWKEHGRHRVKEGEPPLEIFEPYNANLTTPLDELHAEKVEAEERLSVAAPLALGDEGLRLARSWEAVARDGRDFARKGAGMMYWFKVPLGGLAYPEGFRNFLQPALENPRISKIRFMLDLTNTKIPQIWKELVIPQIEGWAKVAEHDYDLTSDGWGGGITISSTPPTTVGWVLGELSQDYTPCFKMFVPDPDTDEHCEPRAQVFLATAERTVRFQDGTMHKVLIPDAVLRVEPEGNASLLQALNVVANQWDALFA